MNNATLITTLGLLLAPWLAQAQGIDADLVRRCRGITDTAQRLLCYDAMPLPAAGGPVAAGRTGGAALSTPGRAADNAVPAAPAAPAAPVAATTGVAGFGLEQQQRQRDEVDAVTSSLPGSFAGWEPRTRFRLANGQVWQVSDDSSGVYNLQSPKVTVRRAALGSFMLEIEGARKAPRVRRVE